MVLYIMPVDPVTLTVSALADPTRRAILARLVTGEATVTELAAPFDMSLPGVSKHLKVLREAGLVTQGRDAQWRPVRLDPSMRPPPTETARPPVAAPVEFRPSSSNSDGRHRCSSSPCCW